VFHPFLVIVGPYLPVEKLRQMIFVMIIINFGFLLFMCVWYIWSLWSGISWIV